MQLFCYHSNHEIEIWYCNSPVVYNTETILHWNAKRQHEIHLITHKWLCLTGFKLVLKSIYDYPSIVVATWYMIKTNCNICNIQQAMRTAWTAYSACGWGILDLVQTAVSRKYWQTLSAHSGISFCQTVELLHLFWCCRPTLIIHCECHESQNKLEMVLFFFVWDCRNTKYSLKKIKT